MTSQNMCFNNAELKKISQIINKYSLLSSALIILVLLLLVAAKAKTGHCPGACMRTAYSRTLMTGKAGTMKLCSRQG